MSDTRQMSFGEKAVGLNVNPSGNYTVNSIKEKFAVVIDELNNLRDKTDNQEVKRQYSIAITDSQTAQMWAVKAATWQ